MTTLTPESALRELRQCYEVLNGLEERYGRVARYERSLRDEYIEGINIDADVYGERVRVLEAYLKGLKR